MTNTGNLNKGLVNKDTSVSAESHHSEEDQFGQFHEEFGYPAVALLKARQTLALKWSSRNSRGVSMVLEDHELS